MRNRWRMGRGLAALMTAALFSVPQTMLARQRCDEHGNNRANYYQSSQSYGYRDSRPSYGYGDRTYQYNDYGRDRYPNYDYRDGGYYGDYRPERSAGKSAAIIGGSAAAGAVVGGLSGGTKGTIIGGAIGGVGGLIYDRATKNGRTGW